MEEKDLSIERPAYWAVLPAAVRYDAELPPNAKLLYAEISALTDQRGFCWASNAYFEKLYSLSERTIIRLIRTLESRGYIQIQDDDGGAKKRKIFAGVNPMGTPDKNVSTPLTKMSVPPDKNVRGTINKKNNNTGEQPPKAPQGARRAKQKSACDYEPELFERFWKLYPRGEAKSSARYEWDKLRPDTELMKKMSAALKRQMMTDEWQRRVGIPYACRWLANHRWEDEVREPSPAETPCDRRDLVWM